MTDFLLKAAIAAILYGGALIGYACLFGLAFLFAGPIGIVVVISLVSFISCLAAS